VFGSSPNVMSFLNLILFIFVYTVLAQIIRYPLKLCLYIIEIYVSKLLRTTHANSNSQWIPVYAYVISTSPPEWDLELDFCCTGCT
jgi:hypothetical protein